MEGLLSMDDEKANGMDDEKANEESQRHKPLMISPLDGRFSIQEYCLFRFAPTINGEELPVTRLKITGEIPSVADFEESIRGMNILAWARFHQLLLKCAEHPEFDAWCEQLGLKLEVEGRNALTR